MISVSNALSILTDYIPDKAIETVPLNKSLGRVCADEIRAKLSLPPRDASAMDGYAVRLQDVRKPNVSLNVVGEVPAGSVFDGTIGPGEAVRVFTGSPIPKGADHIIIQESAVRSGDKVKILIGCDESQHIRLEGLDFKKDDVIIPRLTTMSPAEIALAAAGNYSDLSVLAKLRISILAAGDELVRPGAATALGDVVNSNTFALTALVRMWGGTVSDVGLCKDDPKAIKDMFELAKHSDIIVPVGGASVGDYDHMRGVFQRMGGQMIFEQVAVKPGKPTWFGVLDDTAVLGLPGNPASAIVCAHLFLKHLMGRSPANAAQARLKSDLAGNGPRETYLRARVFSRKSVLWVQPFPRQDSSLLTPFREANVLIRRLPDAEPLEAGEFVDVFELGTGPGVLEPL